MTVQIKFKRYMSKLDAFLWLTVKSYSEVSRISHWRCSVRKVFLEILQSSQENNCARVCFLLKLQAFKHLRTPFLQNTSIRLLLSFYKKVLTNLKNIRQTKAQKRFISGAKKESMEPRETNSNASYCI